MARIRTLNFLPEVFQTPTNSQFLAATLDQIVSEPNTVKQQGYIGSKLGYGVNALDYYVTEPTKTRVDYQLDPSVVFTKPNETIAQDFITYPGILDALKLQGSITDDNSELFQSQFYSWDSFVDLDKLVNYQEYYWLPEGPPSVSVSPGLVYSVEEYIVTDYDNQYGINEKTAQNSGPLNPTLTLLRGGSYTFSVNQNSQFFIQTLPGTSGYSPIQPNIPTREVYGVENNGASTGFVTFDVPLKDAQDEYDFPGNNIVDLICTTPFSQVNGQILGTFTDPATGVTYNGLSDIDGITGIDGLRIMFYNTGISNEVGYINSYYGETSYDVNDDYFTSPLTVEISSTTNSGSYLTLGTGYTTDQLIVNQTITFDTPTLGGLSQNVVYFVKEILNSTDFTISEYIEGPALSVNDDAGTMIANINQGQYQQGFYSTVNDNFYRVQLVGTGPNPTIRLLPDGTIPTNQKITPQFGVTYINRPFYRNVNGVIGLIPIITAPLDVLYYQDGTNPNKVGEIRLVDTNADNYINVDTQIIGKVNYTSPNGVAFTNGLKIIFQGNIFPSRYLNQEYYVEGVGTSIELVPVLSLECPEKFTIGEYIPWDMFGFDAGPWDISLNIPVLPDYITIARNSINKNAWSRSNRWFHTDIITQTANYNNNPDILTRYATLENKAKRPIIEFYPNIKLFDSGSVGKNAVDFFDTRTTDAFSEVAGLYNYYPDVEVYTKNTAVIDSTITSPVSSSSLIVGKTYVITSKGTTNWNTAAGTTGFYYVEGQIFVCESTSVGTGTATELAYGTTITIPTADINGTFQEGMYVADYNNVLPVNTQLDNIQIVGSDTILTVSWDQPQNVDTTTTVIVGSDSTVNAYAVYPGARIVFANDSDLQVRNKIYVVDYATIGTSSQPIIVLSPAEDSMPLPDEMIAVNRGYNYQGKSFYYNGIMWDEAQLKIDVNQPPKFDVFDNNNISFGDTDVYNSSTFKGSTLFAYQIGDGPDDSILGFPIKYSSVATIGDIEFDVTLNSQTFNYVREFNSINQRINTGYVHDYNNDLTYDRLIGWETAIAPSTQYQVFNFDYKITTPNNILKIDIPMIDPIPYGQVGWPTIQVYYNNKYVDSINGSYTVTVEDNVTFVQLNTPPIVDTVVQVLLLSNETSANSYYTIPINLSNNPLNNDITDVKLGDIRMQYMDMFINAPNTTGDVFGKNNYRDCGDLVPYGTKIIQNSASLVLPGLFLRKQNNNLFNALLYNSREYINYKQLLVDTVQNTDYDRRYSPAQILDDAVDQISAARSEINSFFWSDMLPSKTPFRSNTYIFNSNLDTTRYPLSHVYNFESANYDGVLVYITREVNNNYVTKQLIRNVDYTIDQESPTVVVTLDLVPGDYITVNEYNQTYGSYVPNTPSKLGLYPLYIPEVILDSDYITPTYFILGHDGSYTKLYGDYIPEFDILTDFRDQVLLEFEQRIYNNCKLSTEVPIRIYEVLPGFFRESTYTYNEYLEMYSSSFLNWVGQNRLDYKTQYFNRNNEFTYNYTNSSNKLNRMPIQQGNFRGVYEYFYDTSTPNLTPWQMLGFSNMPTWWVDRYGPAPYTSGNEILWNDLEQGYIYNNGDGYIDSLFARPGLSNIIPVDQDGNLLSPLYSIVADYNPSTFQKDWKVGDDGPVEFSYRRSSSYPFDVIRIFALTRPAELYNLGVDLDNYKYNEEFNQYLVNDRSHLVISDIEVYGNGTAKTSYINWIVDYQKQVGVDATTEISTLLDNLDVRLVYRLAGFSDKTLLQFYVEKSSANTTDSALLIPDESYSILLYDNQPFEQLMYSSVIVQLNNDGTFSIYGNAQNFAYFTTYKPTTNSKIENYEVGNVKVTVSVDHTTEEQLVPYGTKFYTAQEVAQFLMNYDAYLQDKGMQFTSQIYGTEINFILMIQEFLYWIQTGWENGSIITLNPSATDIVIEKDGNVVQPLTLQQQNFILNQDLYPIQLNNLCVIRDENNFKVHTLNQGDSMSYAQFNIGNIEQAVVFDNVTLFNDLIYNTTTGLRQNRIYLRGAKTAEWNGTINAWGFILNQDNIKEWSRYVKYPKGIIVKYKNKYWTALTTVEPNNQFVEQQWKIIDYQDIQKGLLPNAANRAYESTLYYNSDKANLEQDADLLSFSLIGYRPRDYLAVADLTDITQVNVYKNLIRNKGTKNATYAFKGANLPQGGIDYTVYENWAIKTGEYGGVLNENFVEFKLDQPSLTGNPTIVSLTNGTPTVGSQQEVPLYDLFNYGRYVTDPNVLNTLDTTDNDILYPTAGYVNYNDVRMSSFYYAGLPNSVDKSGTLIPINDFYVRDYVWLANYKETWQVYTWKPIGQVLQVRGNLNGTTVVTFAEPHNLKKLDSLSIINFANNVNGYYIITEVINLYEVEINLSIPNRTINAQIQGTGIGLTFTSQRVTKPGDISNLDLTQSEFSKNTVWVDENTDGNWAVYRKGLNYNLNASITKESSSNFGSSVAFTNVGDYLIGDSNLGEVYRYSINNDGTYQVTETLSGDTSFGSSIVYATSKPIYAITEPTSANPKVQIYVINTNTALTDDYLLVQTIDAPISITDWGSSVAISNDGNYLFIRDVGNTQFYVYARQHLPLNAGYFVSGETYEITELGDTDFTAIGAIENKVGIIFVATGIGTGTGSATQISYKYANVIDGSSIYNIGDNFGFDISTNDDASSVVITAPNFDQVSGVTDWGSATVYQKTQQTFEAQFTSNENTPQFFDLIWSPNSINKTVLSTNSAGNIITLNNTSALTVNDPIIFYGGGLEGTNINGYKVYYINSISGSNITIKTSRSSTTPVTLATEVTVNADAAITNVPLFVYRNGTLVDDSNYGVINSQLVYTTVLNAGDIINVQGSQYNDVQTFNSSRDDRINIQFGYSVDNALKGSEILIGSPYEINDENQEGQVYRYTNLGAKIGIIIAENECNITSDCAFLLNGYSVYATAGDTAVDVANNINTSKIPNVQASSVNNKLMIEILNENMSIVNSKLQITVVDKTVLEDLGITLYTNTQVISCPHKEGPTQFGKKIKFNEFGSAAIGAPVGTRYQATTFDFTDDENLHNDTVFDNNATRFIDQWPNAGAVYMFDLLANYTNDTVDPGKFAYAQPVNSDSELFGNSPYYGIAIDFNEYNVIVGAPNYLPFIDSGQATVYTNYTGVRDWSEYRQSSAIVDVSKIQDTQLFSNLTNNTLVNLDYMDPLQGKLLGVVRENIDFVSKVDPAYYNSDSSPLTGKVWGADNIGEIWFNTENVRFINYHQNDVVYNSKYWGTLFPGSDVAMYTWVISDVPPSNYPGPGIPYDFNLYSVGGTLNASNVVVPVYYFWVRNSGIVTQKRNKTLSDITLAQYVANPQNSGIAYMAPILPNTFALYNSGQYINADDTVFHLGYANGTSDDVSHSEYALIRENFEDDFLPGLPLTVNTSHNLAQHGLYPAISNEEPYSLYARMLDSLSGCTFNTDPEQLAGQVVPDPFLPINYQSGILVRPRQSFFYDRLLALKNYITYANEVLMNYPITELKPDLYFLFTSGEYYNTADYWEYTDWYYPGYNSATKPTLQVREYADLSGLNVAVNTIVKVLTNGAGLNEFYRYDGQDVWTRVYLQNGTIQFKSSLYDYSANKIGFGGDFFDTATFDNYPSTETRYIIRALNEQIYTEDLLPYRNKSLILLFEYIQSETIESQNYLPWLNKTSLMDVSHIIRELKPYEVFKSDNQVFLEGYINEVKPYHVVIKDFLFKYTGTEEYNLSNLTDFDVPATYNENYRKYISPQLVYSTPNNEYEYELNNDIWNTAPYYQYYNNRGMTLDGQPEYLITRLSTYVSIGDNYLVVDNSAGFPINGTITIDEEIISYAYVDRAYNILYGLVRGLQGTRQATHLPGSEIYMDLPPIVVLDGGRNYVNPPSIKCVYDSAFPEPIIPAILEPIMAAGTLIGVDVVEPGYGYMAQPTIEIAPSSEIYFSQTAINSLLHTINLSNVNLYTGDIVRFKAGTNGVAPTKLVDGEWYYVNVLESVPSYIIALYSNYSDAIKDHDRIEIAVNGTSSDMALLPGAKAYAITSSSPTRENNIKLKFDRTTYTSQVLDWKESSYYSAYFAGKYYQPESLASSSYTLENTMPNIGDLLASASGVVFEIAEVNDDQYIDWSSYIRYVAETSSANNSIRLIPQDNNNDPLNPEVNNSGTTVGFYKNMPIKFVGAVIGNLVDSTTYYVSEILSEIEFTVSESIDGPVFALTNGSWPDNSTLLKCYTGNINSTTILTVNYPSILNVTNTTKTINSITVPLTSIGTGGTIGFYPTLPLFFTSNGNNSVFGNIVENRPYYVNTIIDNENFTISESEDVISTTVTETNQTTDTVTVDSTENFNINDPIIFNNFVFTAGDFVIGQTYTILTVGTTDYTSIGSISNVVGTTFTATGVGSGTGTASSNLFGTIESGTLYCVNEIVSSTELKISTKANFDVYALNDQIGTATLTDQSNTVALTTAEGSMYVNVSLPVSPGQIDGQKFSFYKTSGQYVELSGSVSNLIETDINATISSVDRVALAFNTDMTNFYVNMPIEVSVNVGGLVTGTPYYITEYSGELIPDPDPENVGKYINRPNIQVTVSNTSDIENVLTCDTTESLFVGMPIVFSGVGLGGITIGQQYFVSSINDSTRFTIASTKESTTTVTQVDSITLNITVNDTSIFNVGDGVMFRGSIVGGQLDSTTTYYVETIGVNTIKVTDTKYSNGTLGAPIDPGTGTGNFTIANIVVLTAASGTMIGTGDPYIKLSSTLSPSTPVALTDDNSGSSKMIQYPDPLGSYPTFSISYLLGGYRVLIINSSSGFAINNTITIPGTDVGGSSPANDITLIVNQINTTGEILDVIANGTVPVTSNQYYLQVRSPNTLAVYSDPLMDIPVSYNDFDYVGFTKVGVSQVSSIGNYITVTDSSVFAENDEVIFTGTSLGNIVIGKSYYIYYIFSPTVVIVSETPYGPMFDPGNGTGSASDLTMAKAGSFCVLPEPFYFNQSIVRYNNRLYVCVVSNNDNTFVLGKWEPIGSDYPLLNALDRAEGYYQPTVNMPGRDLTQLFEGITYPNPIVRGNKFEPDQQYDIDTIIIDSPFYPTNVDISSVIYNNGIYLASANLPNYSAIIISLDGDTWGIGKLTEFNIDTTDIICLNGNYIITSTNVVTPVFKSVDGINWSVTGGYIPYGVYDEYGVPVVTKPIGTVGLSLNAITYYNGKYIAAGNNIVNSDDLYTWRALTQFETAFDINLYDIASVNIPGFVGVVSVGSGKRYSYENGFTELVDTDIVAYSNDGVNYSRSNSFTNKALYGVTSDSNTIVVVGEAGVIYYSLNGANYLGVNEVGVTSINAATNQINVNNTAGFNVNDTVQFTGSFGTITAYTTYYIKTIDSSTQITISETLAGTTKQLVDVTAGNFIIGQTYIITSVGTTNFIAIGASSNTVGVTFTATGIGTGDGTASIVINGVIGGTIPEQTLMNYYDSLDPTPSNLNKVCYANGIFFAVGDNGTVRTSSDGIVWTTQTTGTTENLTSVSYVDNSKFVIAGDNNIVLFTEDNGLTYTSNVVFEVAAPIYTIKGADFPYGYGPEELVPGNIVDNLQMIVNTRPGTNWPGPEYGHTGFNVVSVEVIPSQQYQTMFSFKNIVETPAQVRLQVINGSTYLGTTLYPTEYTIDWVNKIITLNEPLNFFPIKDILRIDVYEVGNGDQLVKANTDTDPIRVNPETMFTEIFVNCDYNQPIFLGSGVIKTGTSSVVVRAFETNEITDRITCDDVSQFTLNTGITFQGLPFGGLEENTNYYVKSISYATNSITVSLSYNPVTGLAGPTVELTTATGEMYANIQNGNGVPWTDPIVYHNGNKLVLGTTGLVTRTKASNNALTTNTTAGLIVGTPISFCECIFGGIIEPFVTYYIATIVDDNEFTISATQGGPILPLNDSTGGTTFITNDYAFGIQPDGISAKIMFPVPTYTNNTDYIVYSLLGETAPEQYGYSIPETQYFVGNGATSQFNLDNFVGENNPNNAIVEVDGLRLTASDYVINSIANTILFASPPANGSNISVTTYNDTKQQYLTSQYQLAGNTVSPLTLTVGSTTHSIGTFDQNLPAVQTFDENAPSVVLFDQNLNYLTLLAPDTTSSLNINDNVVFSEPTIGGIVAGRTYYVTQIIDSVSFVVSETVGGDPITLNVYAAGDFVIGQTYVIETLGSTNFTLIGAASNTVGLSFTATGIGSGTGTAYVQTVIGSMPINSSSLQVCKIVNVDNNIVAPISIEVSNTTSGTNQITVSTGFNTTGFLPNQTVIFKGTAFGGIYTDGTVYFVDTVVSSTKFTIKDYDGNQITLSTDSGSMSVEVGGTPTTRITTLSANDFYDNIVVRIDGVLGSTQLNNNIFYVKVITPYVFDIYTEPYTDAQYGINYPVTNVSTYISGGYVWVAGSFFLATTIATETTTSGNFITVDDASELIVGTPVYFNKPGNLNGDVLLGGLVQGTEYYVLDVNYTFNKFTISDVRYGEEFVLTSDIGAMDVIQWSQTNVNRLYVTVNGYRVPSSNLRLNPYNEVSILTEILPGDQVIITSMIPTATPNEQIYMNVVDKEGEQIIYNCNSHTRTWLTYPIYELSDTIQVYDVTKLTNTVVQNVSCPEIDNGYYYIGLTADKRIISSVTVYNNTTNSVIPSEYYEIVLVSIAPQVKILGGNYINEGDSLTITILEGNTIMINGEQIRFTTVDVENNTLNGLERGCNGTAMQSVIPKYLDVFGLLTTNILYNEYYDKTWNSYVYNQVEGDPLQISNTIPAIFLNTDLP